MKILYTDLEYNQAKTSDSLFLECKHCEKPFTLSKKMIKRAFVTKGHIRKNDYCSNSCSFSSQWPAIIVNCTYCGSSFKKLPCKIKKTKNNFCCQSHAAIWNNSHKTKGTRISKLEKWLAVELLDLYPKLEMHFNKTDAINGELDIYIPSIKLAFELNGIFHYEPIYGEEKLKQIKTNDDRKIQACLERGIEICIIDVSHQKYFKEQTSIVFLNIIRNIVDVKLEKNGSCNEN